MMENATEGRRADGRDRHQIYVCWEDERWSNLKTNIHLDNNDAGLHMHIGEVRGRDVHGLQKQLLHITAQITFLLLNVKW